MEVRQTTVTDILNTEHDLVMRGSELYGSYFDNAGEFNALMNNFIKSIDKIDRYIFLAFYSQVKKHHTLALFSAARLHHIQTGMNLRQTIEAGQWAAYAMGNPEEDKFRDKLAGGDLVIREKHEKAMYAWLDQNFGVKAEETKRLKKLISGSVAHASLPYAFNNFDVRSADQPGFALSFFDSDDEYRVKTDLWFVANTAMGLIDLFVGVNQKHQVFQLIDNFNEWFGHAMQENHRLKAEMSAHPRYVEAMKRNAEVQNKRI
jgi:hypothetical protein